jgi:hypothetical protein
VSLGIDYLLRRTSVSLPEKVLFIHNARYFTVAIGISGTLYCWSRIETVQTHRLKTHPVKALIDGTGEIIILTEDMKLSTLSHPYTPLFPGKLIRDFVIVPDRSNLIYVTQDGGVYDGLDFLQQLPCPLDRISEVESDSNQVKFQLIDGSTTTITILYPAFHLNLQNIII